MTIHIQVSNDNETSYITDDVVQIFLDFLHKLHVNYHNKIEFRLNIAPQIVYKGKGEE